MPKLLQSPLKLEARDLYTDKAQGNQIPKIIFIKLSDIDQQRIVAKSKTWSREFKLSNLNLDRKKRVHKFSLGEKKKQENIQKKKPTKSTRDGRKGETSLRAFLG